MDIVLRRHSLSWYAFASRMVGVLDRPSDTSNARALNARQTFLSGFLLILGCFVVAGSADAQVFKGHEIGESIGTFLQNEPAIRALLVDCQQSAPRELTPDEIKKRYGRKALVELEKRQTANSDQSKHVAILDKDQDVYGDRCDALLKVNSDGQGEIDGNGYYSFNDFHQNLYHRVMAGESVPFPASPGDGRDFIFQGGHLIVISLTMHATFQEVRDDLSKRLGVSPVETTIPLHNAYGATWSNPYSTWDTSNVHVELSDDENPAKSVLPKLRIITQHAYQQSLLRQQNRRSSLDK